MNEYRVELESILRGNSSGERLVKGNSDKEVKLAADIILEAINKLSPKLRNDLNNSAKAKSKKETGVIAFALMATARAAYWQQSIFGEIVEVLAQSQPKQVHDAKKAINSFNQAKKNLSKAIAVCAESMGNKSEMREAKLKVENMLHDIDSIILIQEELIEKIKLGKKDINTIVREPSQVASSGEAALVRGFVKDVATILQNELGENYRPSKGATTDDSNLPSPLVSFMYVITNKNYDIQTLIKEQEKVRNEYRKR